MTWLSILANPTCFLFFTGKGAVHSPSQRAWPCLERERLATLSREALMRWRGKMLKTAGTMKVLLGALLAIFGMFTLAGYDRVLQTALTGMAPPWLVSLTTSL